MSTPTQLIIFGQVVFFDSLMHSLSCMCRNLKLAHLFAIDLIEYDFLLEFKLAHLFAIDLIKHDFLLEFKEPFSHLITL